VDNYRKSPNLWTGDLTTRQSPSGKAAVSRVDFTGALGWSAKPSSEAGSANKAGLATLTTEPVVHNEAVSRRMHITSPSSAADLGRCDFVGAAGLGKVGSSVWRRFRWQFETPPNRWVHSEASLHRISSERTPLSDC
jgi:hypothetical protein